MADAKLEAAMTAARKLTREPTVAVHHQLISVSLNRSERYRAPIRGGGRSATSTMGRYRQRHSLGPHDDGAAHDTIVVIGQIARRTRNRVSSPALVGIATRTAEDEESETFDTSHPPLAVAERGTGHRATEGEDRMSNPDEVADAVRGLLHDAYRQIREVDPAKTNEERLAAELDLCTAAARIAIVEASVRWQKLHPREIDSRLAAAVGMGVFAALDQMGVAQPDAVRIASIATTTANDILGDQQAH